jgi:uncharacterized membrane protein HdeD (DUF308 family)
MAAGDEPPVGVPWWAHVVTGVLSAAAGVLAIAFPKITLLALALISGINLMLLGALTVGEALGDDEEGSKTLRIVLGVVGILGGIVIVRRPGETLLVLVVALGVWLTLDGIVALVRAILGRGTERRALTALGGVVDVALGIVVLALPHISLRTLATLIGIAFVVRGGMLVVTGLRERGARAPTSRREPAAPPARPARGAP